MTAKKRRLHHTYTRLRRVSPLVTIAIFLLLLSGTLLTLRQNYMHMDALRNELFAADKSGEGVEESLKALRDYVTTHMNTNLSTENSIYPPIQLKHTYERLTQKEQKRVAAAEKHNKELPKKAQTHCEQRFPAGQIRGRAACVSDYISQNERSTDIKTVPKELYQFNFVSPSWSADTAGLLLLATVFAGFIAVVHSIAIFTLKQKL